MGKDANLMTGLAQPTGPALIGEARKYNSPPIPVNFFLVREWLSEPQKYWRPRGGILKKPAREVHVEVDTVVVQLSCAFP